MSEYEHKSSEFRSISNSTYSFEKRKSGLVHIDEFSNLKFPCPACEEISTSTVQEGANRFSDCSFISALQEMVVLQKEASEFCRNCETKPAEHRCFDCQTELCEDCRVVHGWLQITKRHRVVKLEDLRRWKISKRDTSDAGATMRRGMRKRGYRLLRLLQAVRVQEVFRRESRRTFGCVTGSRGKQGEGLHPVTGGRCSRETGARPGRSSQAGRVLFWKVGGV